MAIDVGAAASDRATFASATWTLVSSVNAANNSGIITVVEIFVNSQPMTGLKVGSFSATGNLLTCRDSSAMPAISSTGLTTLNAQNGDFSPFTIHSGDYIGCYFGAGLIDRDDPGGFNSWIYNGDKLTPGDNFTGTQDDALISFYGTGYQIAMQINIGDVWKDIDKIQINIGDSWKTMSDININVGDDWKSILT